MDHDSQTNLPETMRAVRLHGREDLRVETVNHPGEPGPGQALLQVKTVGICGSDLHTYLDAQIGDSRIQSPVVLGHEFSGLVEVVGEGALDGNFEPLSVGTRVAVDPAQPCGLCEMCALGNPNFCHRLHFCGLYPDDGSLRQWMHMPAQTCFPVSDRLDDVSAALLEPLGIAVHAVDLAHLRVAESVAIVGSGPIGLYILQLAKKSGAHPVFISDKLPWRLKAAECYDGIPINFDATDPVQAVMEATDGRGVDVAIEAAWAGEAIQHALGMARAGGRVVLVGIPADDRLEFKPSIARRKGLTVRFSRRMKHTYPRTIRLVEAGMVDVLGVVSHRFPLDETPAAYAMNAGYHDNAMKVVIEL